MTSKEHQIEAFIALHSQSHLKALEELGGPTERDLSFNIYRAFGIYTGDEGAIARVLESEPMAIMNDIPTFIYNNNGIDLPLLEPYSKGITVSPESQEPAPSILAAMYKSGKHWGEFEDVVIANTPVVQTVLQGAMAIHGQLSNPRAQQPYGMMAIHLGQITTLTAKVRGLEW